MRDTSGPPVPAPPPRDPSLPRTHSHGHGHGHSRQLSASTASGAGSSSSSFKPRHVSRGSVGEKIPGFKTSATFLSSLSANLRISDDDLLPSPATTPPLTAQPNGSMSSPPSLPLAPSSTEAPADEELPPLETHVAITPADQIAGLKLVADSVAQQRQLAARILLYHPLHGALFAALLAGLWHLMYKTRGDIPLIFTTGAGVAMAVLVGARAATAGYIYAAEAVGREWLGEDVVLVTKFGGDVIGSLILGWERGEGRGNRRRKGGRGVVRGWTTKLRYRGKGVGVALLEEAVRIVAEKGGEEIVFDDKHANSKRVLPAMYNAPFDRKEAAYRAVLEDVAAVGLGGGKKR